MAAGYPILNVVTIPRGINPVLHRVFRPAAVVQALRTSPQFDGVAPNGGTRWYVVVPPLNHLVAKRADNTVLVKMFR